MSLMDETIRLDIRKQDVTIASTNKSTYMVSEQTGLTAGRRMLDPYYNFEFSALFPSDANVITGDMVITSDDSYFLIMSIETKYYYNAVNYYKCILYKCNSNISIYYYDSSTKKHSNLFASNVKCLITQVRSQEWLEDKTVAIKNYYGKQQPFQIFAQADCGITNACILVDQANRRFRVGKESNLFIADGILQCQVVQEQ